LNSRALPRKTTKEGKCWAECGDELRVFAFSALSLLRDLPMLGGSFVILIRKEDAIGPSAPDCPELASLGAGEEGAIDHMTIG
jgi:hypothetical protein